MKVHDVQPSTDTRACLAGAQFADAYRIEVTGPALDARTAAMRIMLYAPAWFRALLKLRNILVTPFGLKTSAVPGAKGIIGLFPVVSETPERLVAGFDDRHLDFRIVLDVTTSGTAPQGPRQEITSTTLVRTHSLLGRAYLALVLPFHRLIVRAMLRQSAL